MCFRDVAPHRGVVPDCGTLRCGTVRILWVRWGFIKGKIIRCGGVLQKYNEPHRTVMKNAPRWILHIFSASWLVLLSWSQMNQRRWSSTMNGHRYTQLHVLRWTSCCASSDGKRNNCYMQCNSLWRKHGPSNIVGGDDHNDVHHYSPRK